mmetsp:Transcript_60735/g.136834  ORF Transcript_60735/g.136834 Transcript_60735/m.136834 type:complete len:216 (-) Transcript_60735:628-1275(-)
MVLLQDVQLPMSLHLNEVCLLGHVPADGRADDFKFWKLLLEECLNLLLAVLFAGEKRETCCLQGEVAHGNVRVQSDLRQPPLFHGEHDAAKKRDQVDERYREEVVLLHRDKLALLLHDVMVACRERLRRARVVFDRTWSRVEEEGQNEIYQRDEDAPHNDQLLPVEVQHEPDARDAVFTKVSDQFVLSSTGCIMQLVLLPKLQTFLKSQLIDHWP